MPVDREGRENKEPLIDRESHVPWPSEPQLITASLRPDELRNYDYNMRGEVVFKNETWPSVSATMLHIVCSGSHFSASRTASLKYYLVPLSLPLPYLVILGAHSTRILRPG